MITEADLDKCHLVEEAHYNGGEKFYGFGCRCVEYPRLYIITKHYKTKPRGVRQEIMVDGVEVDGFADVVKLLNTPPLLTDAEVNLLQRVPFEYTCSKEFDFLAMHSLNNKGQIEYENGMVRRRVMAEFRRA